MCVCVCVRTSVYVCVCVCRKRTLDKCNYCLLEVGEPAKYNLFFSTIAVAVQHSVFSNSISNLRFRLTL